jgi:hypothetical protein
LPHSFCADVYPGAGPYPPAGRRAGVVWDPRLAAASSATVSDVGHRIYYMLSIRPPRQLIAAGHCGCRPDERRRHGGPECTGTAFIRRGAFHCRDGDESCALHSKWPGSPYWGKMPWK